MNLRIMARAAVSTAVILLTACTTTPKANFYVLHSAAPAVSTPDVASAPVLAIGPVDLPQYLDRPHIVTRAGGNRLQVDEFNRWGGSLEEDITRVLAQRIGARLGTRRVYGYPSRVVEDTDLRIALDIRAFEGVLGGEVVLEVAWSLIDDRNGILLRTDQARYTGDATGEGYEAYAAALGATLVQFADDLAQSISGLRQP